MQGGVTTGPLNENAGTPTGGPGGHGPPAFGKKSTETLAAVDAAGEAHGVVGQLGHFAVSVKTMLNVPPGKATRPMPVGADLARLSDLRQGDGERAQASNELPIHAGAGGGAERMAMQQPVTMARNNFVAAELVFISWLL